MNDQHGTAGTAVLTAASGVTCPNFNNPEGTRNEAIVTGAGYKGIGGATCIRLARDAKVRGLRARIAVCATGKRKELPTLIDEIKAAGADAILLTGDLCDPEVPPRLVTEALDFCGGLDAVVSNAGVGKPAPMLETGLDDWNFQMNLHARAAWLLAKAAYPALKASGGSIVATASMSGYAPHAGNGAYPIAKAALIMLCRTLAIEWARMESASMSFRQARFARG